MTRAPEIKIMASQAFISEQEAILIKAMNAVKAIKQAMQIELNQEGTIYPENDVHYSETMVSAALLADDCAGLVKTIKFYRDSLAQKKDKPIVLGDGYIDLPDDKPVALDKAFFSGLNPVECFQRAARIK